MTHDDNPIAKTFPENEGHEVQFVGREVPEEVRDKMLNLVWDKTKGSAPFSVIMEIAEDVYSLAMEQLGHDRLAIDALREHNTELKKEIAELKELLQQSQL